MLVPPFIAPAHFDDADAALARVREIYDASVAHLRVSLRAFVNGRAPAGRVRACYPFVRVHTDTVARADSRLSYGFVAGPGPFRELLPRAVPPAAREPQRRARGRHQRAADPGPLLVRRARPHRRQP